MFMVNSYILYIAIILMLNAYNIIIVIFIELSSTACVEFQFCGYQLLIC